MMAAASFYPPVGAGKPIEFIEVQELLSAKGLRFGIDWETVKSSILSCNTSRRALSASRWRGVAGLRTRSPPAGNRADPPQEGSPEDPAAQAVDFKAISPFRFVKKGDTLARITPRIDGVAGIDVMGAAVAYGKSLAQFEKPGRTPRSKEGSHRPVRRQVRGQRQLLSGSARFSRSKAMWTTQRGILILPATWSFRARSSRASR